MKNVSKKLIIFFLVALMGFSMMALPVSAANGIILTPSADSVQPGKTMYVDVGIALDNGVSGGKLEVTYNPQVLWFSKAASTKTPEVTDTIDEDATNAKITILFAPTDIANQVTQKLVFVVTNNSTPGSTGDITVKVLEASDADFAQLTSGQVGGGTLTKTITVASAPTPTPTPTPTTPVWTPGATTPAQTQAPAGTDEIDPSATPGEEETLEPSETPEASPTEAPVVTNKPAIASPTSTDDQALLIKSGALGFWMMVVLIVGIWVGIAIGYFIWGRRKGRAVRRSKIIGNDEF